MRDRPAGAAAAARAPAAIDTITLHATPPIPPVGVPIDADGGPIGEGVHLGAPLNTRYVAPNRNEQVQMVALDRTDLSKVANNSYSGDPTGTAQLVSDVKALSSSDLVIIATPSSSQPRAITDPQALANLNQAVEAIGGADLPADVVTTDDCLDINPKPICTNFSVIGVPGQAAGTAAENAGLNMVAGRNTALRGSLRGYLQVDQNGNYHYLSGDFASFDTSTPASTATQNVMAINGQTYPSDTLPSGQAGFQLVTLESDSLDSQLNLTYPVSGAGLSDTDAASGLAAIDGLLAQAANDPTQLVFLQSIGSVQTQRRRAGCNARLERGRDRHVRPRRQRLLLQRARRAGRGRDLRVRRPRRRAVVPVAVGEDGQHAGHGHAWAPDRRARRNTLSQYYPQLAGSKASLDFSLPFLAYQDTVPWPDRDTPGHLAALSCVAQALGLPEPIESNYLNESFSFSSVQTSLSRLTFLNVQTSANPACENPTYTQQDFNDVQGQLNQELQDGAGVSKLITNLQLPLGASADAANANVLDIAQAIQSSLGNPNSNASADTADALEDLVFIASGVVPEAGGALGVAASIDALANAALQDSSGGPLLANVQTNATQLLVTFAEDYESLWAQLGATGNILLSDWGKLKSAYQRSLTSWSWSTQDTTNGTDALTGAAKLFTFEALVPLQYETYDFGDSGYQQSLPVPPTDGRDYQCPSKSLQFPDQTIPQVFTPFSGAPTAGLTVVTEAGPVTDLWMLGNTDQTFLSNDPDTRSGATGPIPASVYNAMFTDPTNQNIESPALPSELRFDLESYNGPSTLTSNGGFSPDVYCNVNGQRPS